MIPKVIPLPEPKCKQSCASVWSRLSASWHVAVVTKGLGAFGPEGWAIAAGERQSFFAWLLNRIF